MKGMLRGAALGGLLTLCVVPATLALVAVIVGGLAYGSGHAILWAGGILLKD